MQMCTRDEDREQVVHDSDWAATRRADGVDGDTFSGRTRSMMALFLSDNLKLEGNSLCKKSKMAFVDQMLRMSSSECRVRARCRWILA